MGAGLVNELMHKENQLRYQLQAVQRDITDAQSACAKMGHQWLEPTYFPEVIPGYTLPAYHQGVHHQNEERVPDLVKPRWKRRCSNCLLEELTSSTTEQITKTPKFKGD